MKSTNKAYQGQYTCGASGINKGNGTLLKRLKTHEINKTQRFNSDGSQRYRHKISPFERFWAVNLNGWTKLGCQLAEHALFAHIASSFVFCSESCFRSNSDDELKKILDDILSNLKKFEEIGNFNCNYS
jgi:hypothetical protein